MSSIFSGFGYTPPPAPTPAQKKQQSSGNEVDYNQNPTKLFKRLEDRAWAPSLSRLEKNPNEAKIWVLKRAFDGSTTWKRLPIHQACISKPTAKIILTLLQSYPNSARQIDSDRRLPIHHACANGASMEVIKHLLMAHPESINAEDIWFKTPLQTLLSTPNPNPGVVQALKKGPQYYRMKVSEARSRMNNKTASLLNSNSSVVSQGRGTDNSKDREMIVKLEEEIGKFSERLAASVDQENVLKKKIFELENKTCNTDVLQSENEKLRSELMRYEREMTSFGAMQRELDVKDDHICRIEEENQHLKDDLNQYRKDLLDFDDLKASEDNLRRQLDKITQGDNERIREMESKFLQVSDALRDAEIRIRDFTNNNERDTYNLKRDLNDAIEDAETAKRKANMYQEEQKSMMNELDALRAIAGGKDDISNDLKKKLTLAEDEKEKLVKEMEQLDNHLFSMEKKLEDANEVIKRVEKEKEEMNNSKKALKDSQTEVQDKNKRIEELEKKVNISVEENENLKQRLHEVELQGTERQMSFNIECQNMGRQIDMFEDELQRATKKQAAAEEDKEEVERKLKEQKEKNEALEASMDILKKRDKEITREVEGINKSIDDKVGEYRKKWVKEQNEVQRLSLINQDKEEQNYQLQDQVATLNRMKDDLLRKFYDMQAELDNQEHDTRTLGRETMSIMAQKDGIEMENKRLQETVSSLVKKLDEVANESEKMRKKALENNDDAKTELEQLQATNDKLKKVMIEEIDEKEELEAKVSFLMEEIERLESAQNIPKEINAVLERGMNGHNDPHLDETKELYAKIEELEANNRSLRLLVQEQGEHNNDSKSTTSESIDLLEKRLNLLEEAKDEEICMLQDEKIALEKLVSDLNTKLNDSERHIKELTASNQIYSNELKSIVSKTESEKKAASQKTKKKSILERLAAMESSRSVAGEGAELLSPNIHSSVSPKSRSRALSHDENSSQVSGMTSIFSSTPNSSPRHSPFRSEHLPFSQPSTRSRSRFMEALETRSASIPSNTRTNGYENGRNLNKKLLSKLKSYKDRDLEGIFPSSMTVSGLSLDGDNDGDNDVISATAGLYAKYEKSKTQQLSAPRHRNSSPLSSKLRDARNTSPSTTRERILAILEE